MNKWLKIVQQKGTACLRFSCYCLLCLQPSARDFALCESCEKTLPWLANPCHRCALPLAMPNQTCIKCMGHSAPNYSLQALFHYARPLDGFIAQFKYGEKLHFAKLLGNLLAKHLSLNQTVDCIVPIPLHPTRQQKRGFNQTLEIARTVSKMLKLPMNRFDCTKVRDTRTQSSLSRSGREKNIPARSFVIKPQFQAKHVLVIEDIVTTGATVSAFTQALKSQGVQTVQIWTVCRTVLNQG